MKINIVAGGPEKDIPNLADMVDRDSRDIWIGVDRGALRLIQFNILPDEAFGDFDSVTSEELALIQEKSKTVHEYPAEKNETDLELAIDWALEQDPDTISIFGATGGRLDHALGNILMLANQRYRGLASKIKLIDTQNELGIYEPGEYSLSPNEKKYVSFIPISESVSGLTLSGFKYPLTNHLVHRGSSLTISNELNSNLGTFSFSHGILMLIRSKD